MAPPIKDLTGKKFNYLTVIKFAYKKIALITGFADVIVVMKKIYKRIIS